MDDPPAAPTPPPSSSSLVIQLRQLLSFDSPRVFVGQRLPVIKTEKRDDEDLSPDPHLAERGKDHHPLATTQLTSCSLCTHTPGDDKHLSILFFSDPVRHDHLCSLLLRTRGDEENLIFCSLCRHLVTRLFQLKEEVADIEGRIRGVVKLREVMQPGVKGIEDESRKSADDDEHQLTDRRESSDLACSAKGSRSLRTSGVHPREVKTVGNALKRSLHKKDKTLYNGVLPPIIPSFKKRGGLSVFRCPQCWKHFTRKENVLYHMSTFHGLNLKHIIKKRGKRTVCLVCKSGFHDMDVFKAHSHPDPGDPTKVIYTCAICRKVFGFPHHLCSHRDAVHLKKYRVTCPLCKKVFASKKNLQNHSRTCSTLRKGKVGDDVCSIGGKEGRDKVWTSTKCYLCSQVLKDLGSLANHLRIHSLQVKFGD